MKIIFSSNFSYIEPLSQIFNQDQDYKCEMRKGLIIMTNEVIKKCIDKNCMILCARSGGINVVTGKIVSIADNWIEVECKKNTVLVNAEFVQSIEINTK